MRRDLSRFDGTVYDLIIVGAGIYGACIARDAALRGLKVALIERGDFGNATSYNSLKLIHGGLRCLQYLHVQCAREYIRERRNWLAIAPHLIRPLKFVIPTYGHGAQGREALWLALRLYDAIAADRNRGLPREQHIPQGGIVSSEECSELLPGLSRKSLTGGAFWYDAQMLDANRVLLECLQDAYSADAVIANYFEAKSLLIAEKRVAGVHAIDRLTGEAFEVRGRLVVIACGPWNDSLLRQHFSRSGGNNFSLTKSMNIVTRRILDGYAAGIVNNQPPDNPAGWRGRLLFITPWHDCSVIGTSHFPYEGHPYQCQFTGWDIEQFLCEINKALPSLKLTPDDVLYCYGGLTPAENAVKYRGIRRSQAETIIDHRYNDGVEGVISVSGAKYTSARLVAERTVDRVFRKFGKSLPPCSTATRPLPGAKGFSLWPLLEKAATQRLRRPLDEEEARLAAGLGANLREVLQQSHDVSDNSGQVSLFRLLSRYSVKHEMAVRLEDVLLRRMDQAQRGKLPEGFISWCANMMQQDLGWTAQRRLHELAIVRDRLEKNNPFRVASSAADCVALQYSSTEDSPSLSSDYGKGREAVKTGF